ncbi:hypothetical protein [Brevibacillus porteri]|uniref:hypothetical protein n=1 Tax=Brevibacillus porteri TaxID=2126350 RepID=UPI003D1FFC50
MSKKNNTNNKKQQKQKKSWSWSDRLALVAIIISLSSAVFSFMQYNLSLTQDTEKKTAVWVGQYQNQEMTFESYNSDIRLQYAAVYFPMHANGAEFLIRPPENKISVENLEIFLSRHYSSRQKYVAEDYSSNGFDSYLPFVISSNYVAAGQSYHQKSFYHLNYSVDLSDNPSRPPVVSIHGPVFMKHMEDYEDPQGVVDLLWKVQNQQK